MIEKGKILKGLEICSKNGNCYKCPYYSYGCGTQLMSDLKQLLDSSQITPPDLRPCIVNGRKAYFHNWENVQKISHSFMGNVEGQVAYAAGLVEFEDGQMQEVEPNDIKFTDRSAKR